MKADIERHGVPAGHSAAVFENNNGQIRRHVFTTDLKAASVDTLQRFCHVEEMRYIMEGGPMKINGQL